MLYYYGMLFWLMIYGSAGDAEAFKQEYENRDREKGVIEDYQSVSPGPRDVNGRLKR